MNGCITHENTDKYHDKKIVGSNENIFECSICLNKYKKNVIKFVELGCRHIYCKSCIVEWANTSYLSRCPLCRKKFSIRGSNIYKILENFDYKFGKMYIKSTVVKGGYADMPTNYELTQIKNIYNFQQIKLVDNYNIGNMAIVLNINSNIWYIGNVTYIDNDVYVLDNCRFIQRVDGTTFMCNPPTREIKKSNNSFYLGVY